MRRHHSQPFDPGVPERRIGIQAFGDGVADYGLTLLLEQGNELLLLLEQRINLRGFMIKKAGDAGAFLAWWKQNLVVGDEAVSNALLTTGAVHGCLRIGAKGRGFQYVIKKSGVRPISASKRNQFGCAKCNARQCSTNDSPFSILEAGCDLCDANISLSKVRIAAAKLANGSRARSVELAVLANSFHR